MTLPPPHPVWLIAVLCLTGCGGGTGVIQSDPYPRLHDLTPSTALSVVSSNTTFDNPTAPTRFAPTGGTVAIAVRGNGSEITTVNLSVTDATSVSFQQAFNTFVAQLDSNGATVLYSSTVTASDGSERSLLFANSNYALFNLNYMTLGFWEYEASGSATSGVGGAYAAGIETRANDLPTTGTANYTGGMIGRLADGNGSWAVSASAAASADFAGRTVSLTTSNSFKAPAGGGAAVGDSSLNLSGSLSYSAGINQLSGQLMTGPGGMTGPVSAKFFGPGAQELGGTYFITNGSNQQMSGAFGLHQ
jgi:hypothetical protein